jgi:hypothetical protein
MGRRTLNAPWPDQSRFHPAPTVRRIRLGNRSVLFCERAQRLFELNSTADAIWGALLAQSTPRAAKKALVQLGLEPAAAEDFVDGQLGHWLRQGYWAPFESPSLAPVDSWCSLHLRVDQLDVEIRCPDPPTRARLEGAFAPFCRRGSSCALVLSIIAWEGGFHIFAGEDYCGSVADDELTPRVKAILTDTLIRRPCDGFYAHGALLARGSATIFLAGPPGAGKSTLAVALAARGYDYLADDIVRVDSTGLFKGVSFAPAVKQGAWPLLARYYPQLPQWPVEMRTDGQPVRYAPIAPAAPLFRTPNYFLALSREEGRPAQMAAFDPVEALSMILADAFAIEGRLTADQMTRLAERLRYMNCRRLYYSDLEDALREIEPLGRV